ncbi:MAG: peroxiredoxin [Verrucomicrobia subdivision 3 bacterium]|nr:peroxiredoxin [Limisphaerales bacterium]
MKSMFKLSLGIVVAAAFAATAAEPSKTPKVGDKAPLVEGKDQDGKSWKLADQAGKNAVLLYFYPKDDTPGCTKEACGFRDQMTDLKKAGVEVVGVSFDNEESHKKFRERHNLNFTLLADAEGKITDTYGVRRGESKMARRASFLIDKQGKIVHVTDTPSADTHLAEMKEAVAKLKQS